MKLKWSFLCIIQCLGVHRTQGIIILCCFINTYSREITVLLAVDHTPVRLHFHPRVWGGVQVLGNSPKRKSEMATTRREQTLFGEDSNEVAITSQCD